MGDPFLVALSFILMHEMDAVRCHEWRIFPGLSRLDNRKGFVWFLMAHLPLFTVILGGLNSSNGGNWRIGLDLFFIIHIGLHLLLLRHPRNEFKDWVSWTLIVGAGFFGLLDLVYRLL